MGRAMVDAHETVGFLIGQYHAKTLSQRKNSAIRIIPQGAKVKFTCTGLYWSGRNFPFCPSLIILFIWRY
jgi:hypothetical protein